MATGGRRNPQRPLPPVTPAGQAPGVPVFDWSTFDPSMIPPGGRFADELTTYRDRLPELLAREGEYVVIKGRDVVGIFPTRQGAIREAIGEFGDQPALVKKIVAREPLAVLGHAVL